MTSSWKTATFRAQLNLAEKLRWLIDSLEVEAGRFEARGWFLVPFSEASAARFLLDGDTVFAPAELTPDPLLERHFHLLPPDTCYRFTARGPAVFSDGFLRLEFLPAGRVGSEEVTRSAWHLLDPELEPPLPHGDNVYRVIASEDLFAYRIGGATTARRLDDYLRDRVGRPVDAFERVLDWGCGCGRLSRYLLRLGCNRLHGVDIDGYNVDWCKENLPGAEFARIELMPPLPFPDEHFDLVIGISVLTHLREEVQFAWLHELRRVLKPGGLALLTIMSPNIVALSSGGHVAEDPRSGATVTPFLEELAEGSFLVVDDNDQLSFGEGESYYVNTYHTHEYILRAWQPIFQVVEIVDFLGAHQDAVVLRRE